MAAGDDTMAGSRVAGSIRNPFLIWNKPSRELLRIADEGFGSISALVSGKEFVSVKGVGSFVEFVSFKEFVSSPRAGRVEIRNKAVNSKKVRYLKEEE
jgi:hypothetical protein